MSVQTAFRWCSDGVTASWSFLLLDCSPRPVLCRCEASAVRTHCYTPLLLHQPVLLLLLLLLIMTMITICVSQVVWWQWLLPC
jgi:hypothetical protein